MSELHSVSAPKYRQDLGITYSPLGLTSAVQLCNILFRHWNMGPRTVLTEQTGKRSEKLRKRPV